LGPRWANGHAEQPGRGCEHHAGRDEPKGPNWGAPRQGRSG
jgi:hypothetical protein